MYEYQYIKYITRSWRFLFLFVFFETTTRERMFPPPFLMKCLSRRIASAELPIGGLRLIPVPGAAGVMVVDRPLQACPP